MRLTNETPFVMQKLTATHRRAMAIPNGDVQGNSSYFCVISQTDRETVHIVEKIHDTCPFGCNLVCHQCNVCVHAYQCSCADYIVKCNMCTHVHKVCHFAAGKPDVQLPDSASDIEVLVDLDVEAVDSSPADSRHQCDEVVQELNVSIERLVEVRDTKICCSVQVVKMAKRKVDEAIAILTNKLSSPKTAGVSKLKRLSPRKRAAKSDNSDSKESPKRPENNQQPEPANHISLYEPQEIEVEMVDVSATFDHIY